MASQEILYHCGCQFETHDLNEALAHADELGHDMSVHGIIKSSTWDEKQSQRERLRYEDSYKRPTRRKASAPKPIQRVEQPKAEFNNLRALLNRRK